MRSLYRLYHQLVLTRPWLMLALFAIVLIIASLKLNQFRLDASAESLVLENDRSLEQYRQVNRRFTTSDDFLIVTYTPEGELFSEEGLARLGELRDELQSLEAVGSTNSILNVPLLHSPGLTLDTVDSEIKTLDEHDVAPDTARQALLNNPLYPNLLISEDGRTTAIQVNLPTPDRYFELLRKRNELRDKADAGNASESELAELEQHPSLRAVLITGAGEKSFVAGADIAEMRDKTPEQARAFAGQALSTIKRLETLPVPVVALVNGFCLGGGCELALACDWAVASDNAVFGQPEVLLGVIPGFGGTQRLPRRIGPAMAIDLCTTGRKIDANEALRIGLVNRVMPQAELEAYADELTKQIGGNGPRSVRAAKQAIHDGMDQDLDSALALENALFAFCFAGGEQTEGMSAFVEKRKPNF